MLDAKIESTYESLHVLNENRMSSPEGSACACVMQ